MKGEKITLILSLILFSVSCFTQNRYVTQTTKKFVDSRDGGKCQCCGSYEKIEYDHISPYSLGGSSDISNIQLLYQKYNRSKSNSCYCKVHNKKVGFDCGEGKTTPTKTVTTTKHRQYSTTARQCSGTTKKGVRCKNRTKNSSGRCHCH